MLRTHLGGLFAASIAAMSMLTAGSSAVAAHSDPGVTSASRAAMLADWHQFRDTADHRGWNRSESTLSVSNVSSLHVRWSIAGGFNSSPAVANGVVYNGDADLTAYGPSCASGPGFPCDVLWHGGTGYPDWASPAVGGGYVYMQSVNGLSVFKVNCRTDRGLCSPVWSGTNASNGYTSPAFADGWLFVASEAAQQLQAYDTVRCATAGGTCAPDWVAPLNGVPESSPAVAKGMVYAITADGIVEAFAEKCGSGGATCSPAWTANMHAGFEASPMIAKGLVFVIDATGLAHAFAANCSTNGGSCEPIWSRQLLGHTHASPAATDTTVYFASGRRVYAFSIDCIAAGKDCRPLWKSGRHPSGGGYASSPAVANGVLYIGTQGLNQTRGRLIAFDANCATDGSVCTAIWRSDLLGSMVNSSPAVAHGQVYVASNGGTFYAFSLPTP